MTYCDIRINGILDVRGMGESGGIEAYSVEGKKYFRRL